MHIENANGLAAAIAEATIRTQYTQTSHEVVDSDGFTMHEVHPMEDPDEGAGYYIDGINKYTFRAFMAGSFSGMLLFVGIWKVLTYFWG